MAVSILVSKQNSFFAVCLLEQAINACLQKKDYVVLEFSMDNEDLYFSQPFLLPSMS